MTTPARSFPALHSFDVIMCFHFIVCFAKLCRGWCTLDWKGKSLASLGWASVKFDVPLRSIYLSTYLPIYLSIYLSIYLYLNTCSIYRMFFFMCMYIYIYMQISAIKNGDVAGRERGRIHEWCLVFYGLWMETTFKFGSQTNTMCFFYGFKWLICMNDGWYGFRLPNPECNMIQSTLRGCSWRKRSQQKGGYRVPAWTFQGMGFCSTINSVPSDWFPAWLSGVSHSEVSEEVPGSKLSCACGSMGQDEASCAIRIYLTELVEHFHLVRIYNCCQISRGLKQRNQ